MLSRQTFNINTDTGTQGDTGPNFMGCIHSVHWRPSTADTGADLSLVLINSRGDTGGGIGLLNDNDCLGADFDKQPSLPLVDTDGLDTGPNQNIGFVSAGERLRVKVTPGGAAVAGKLMVYVDQES